MSSYSIETKNTQKIPKNPKKSQKNPKKNPKKSQKIPQKFGFYRGNPHNQKKNIRSKKKFDTDQATCST